MLEGKLLNSLILSILIFKMEIIILTLPTSKSDSENYMNLCMQKELFKLYNEVVCAYWHVRLFVTPWTAAQQAPLSTGSSRQEFWSRLPFPTPGDLLDPGNEPWSSASPEVVGRFFTTEPSRKPIMM